MGNRFSNSSRLLRRRWAGYIKSRLWAAQLLSPAHESEGNITSSLTWVNDEHVSVTRAHPESITSSWACALLSVRCAEHFVLHFLCLFGIRSSLQLLDLNPEKGGEMDSGGCKGVGRTEDRNGRDLGREVDPAEAASPGRLWEFALERCLHWLCDWHLRPVVLK